MATSKRGTASGSRASTTRSPSPSVSESPPEYLHKPIGVFEEDLPAFCEETDPPTWIVRKIFRSNSEYQDVWNVAPGSLRPGLFVNETMQVRRVSRVPEQLGPTPEPADGADVGLRRDELQYSTIRVSDSADFFKPSVKLEAFGAADEVNAAIVSCWNVSPTACKSLLWACDAQFAHGTAYISTLVFTNTRLCGKSLDMIANYLESHQTLSVLRIEGNQTELDPNRIARFLASDFDSGARSSLRTLGLRFNALSDDAAYAIATALSTNTTLLALNAYGNAIGDPGAIRIFRALRLNRVLRALDLGRNRIGDMTMAEAVETLTEFALTHEEIVQRRRLLYGGESGGDETSGEQGESRAGRPTKTAGKKSTTKTSSSSGRKDTTKKGKGGKAKPDRVPSEEDLIPVPKSPLLQIAGKNNEGEFVCEGNDIVNYINLSYNAISTHGIQLLHNVVTFQKNANLRRTTTGQDAETQDITSRFRGVVRLLVHHNVADVTDAHVAALNRELEPLDPRYKAPDITPSSPDAISPIPQ